MKEECGTLPLLLLTPHGKSIERCQYGAVRSLPKESTDEITLCRFESSAMGGCEVRDDRPDSYDFGDALDHYLRAPLNDPFVLV